MNAVHVNSKPKPGLGKDFAGAQQQITALLRNPANGSQTLHTMTGFQLQHGVPLSFG